MSFYKVSRFFGGLLQRFREGIPLVSSAGVRGSGAWGLKGFSLRSRAFGLGFSGF